MKLIVKKESQITSIEEKELKNEYSFGIEVSGIRTKEDIQEVIHQCKLVESQLFNGLGGSFNEAIFVKGNIKLPQES